MGQFIEVGIVPDPEGCYVLLCSTRFDFDVFLSYNSRDEVWTKRLKERLAAQGLRVWLDRDQIRPGDLFVEALGNGLKTSRAVVLICSPESVGSRWVMTEYNRALVSMNDADEPPRIIPVLLRDAQLPEFLQILQWVDFRKDEEYEQSLRRLVWGVTGEWPQAPPVPELADLHEIMLTARSSLTVWGLALDRFARDARVRKALGELFDRGVTVTLMLLNPHSNYARAHEPFHPLRSRSEASIDFLKTIAEYHEQPPLFHAYLTDYMPRFRTILVDGETCYVSLYLYGEDAGAVPEFKLSRSDDGNARKWFDSIAGSVSQMLESSTAIPLIQAGHYNDDWGNCRVATMLGNCLSTRCCRPDLNCWTHVRRVILGYQDTKERLAGGSDLIDSGYEAGTNTIDAVSVQAPFLSPALDFDPWVRGILEDDMKVIARACPALARSPAWGGAVRNVLETLNFDPPGPQESLKKEIWYQEYSDILRRLLLTFLTNDPDRELDLYPALTSLRRDFLFEVLDYLTRHYKLGIREWLHLSVAAGLLGVDEKPTHAATSQIVEGSGIQLDRKGEVRAQEVQRVAEELWQLSKSPCRIDATDAFLTGIEKRHRDFTLVGFSDDYLETIVLLRYYEELLRQFPHLEIHLVPRSMRCSNDASFNDVKEMVEHFECLKDCPRFIVEPNGPKLGGVNLRKLHPGIVDLLRTCTAIDVRGARNYEMLQGVKKEAYFGFMVCRDFSESVTGLRAEEKPFVYIVHQPGDRSFKGFKERHLRIEGGKQLAARTVADDRDRWAGIRASMAP
ncbi:MAG: TIR domain-containing protein [Candidatus Solibacter sp.]|nr:TIR domain-containing protein [Candidatus Solibacter sp.]